MRRTYKGIDTRLYGMQAGDPACMEFTATPIDANEKEIVDGSEPVGFMMKKDGIESFPVWLSRFASPQSMVEQQKLNVASRLTLPGKVFINHNKRGVGRPQLFADTRVLGDDTKKIVRFSDDFMLPFANVVQGTTTYQTNVKDVTVMNIHDMLDLTQERDSIMFFGPSGSGKTHNVGMVLEYLYQLSKNKKTGKGYISPSENAAEKDFEVHVSVVYGQAVLRNGNLEVTNRQDINLKIPHIDDTDDASGSPSKRIPTSQFGVGLPSLCWHEIHGRFTDYTDSGLKYPGYLTRLQMMLQTMKGEPNLEKFHSEKNGVRFVKQNVNNKQSSRCATIFTVRFKMRSNSQYREIVIIDAAGNESTYDILAGMFNLNKYHKDPNNPTEHEKNTVLEDFLASRKIPDRATVNLSKTITDDKHELANPPAWSSFKYDVSGLVPDPSQEKALFSYAKELVMESLFINLLIGQMALTTGHVNDVPELKQRSTMLLVGNKISDDRYQCKTLFDAEMPGRGYTDHIRFMYPDNDSYINGAQQNMDEIHMKLRTEDTSATDAIIDVKKYLRNAEGVLPSVKSVIVLPYTVASETQQRNTRNAALNLTNLLIGELEPIEIGE